MKYEVEENLKPVLLTVFALFCLRLLFVSFGPIDLSPDEAHYWEWSRYLDLSYYSKPPLVAWLNYISTSIFGHTHLGVRFFSCLALSVFSLIAFLIAKNASNQRAGWFALLLINLTPEFAAGGLMMTPDVPSLTFWALGLYLLTKINFDEFNIAYKKFILLGVIIGFAGLAKYTAALFYPLLGLYLLVDKNRRAWFLKPHIYVAGIVSLVMQLPVFYWNYMHDFIGLKHVIGQNTGNSDFSGLKSLGNFIGGQFGVLSPITFVLLVCAWVGIACVLYRSKNKSTEKYKVLEILWYFSAPVFVAFLVKSTGSKVQPNWPVLSIFGGFVLLAIWVDGAKNWIRRTFIAGLIFSTLLTIVSHDTFIIRHTLKLVGSDFVLPFKRDPLRPALGWRGLGEAITAKIEPLLNGETPIVLTTRYQTASELAFYMKGNPRLIYINPGYRRQNQYDLWNWPEKLADKPVIYVRENKTIEPVVFNAFESCAHLGEVASARYNVVMRKANVYICFGYKGVERPLPEVY